VAKSTTTYEVLLNLDVTADRADRADFEHVEFVNCIFGDLSKLNFTNCYFKNCNLSNAKTIGSRLQNCLFKDSKLLGTNFSGARDLSFEVHFENCNLDYSSFDKKKMNKSSFKNCKIHHSNFTQCDLSKSTLSNCDLFETLFSGTNLSGLDFTENRNFMIDPETNALKGTKFLTSQLAGLLYRYPIIITH